MAWGERHGTRDEGSGKPDAGRGSGARAMPVLLAMSRSRSCEPVQREPLQLFPYRLLSNVLQHASGEGVGEQLAGSILTNAPALHVEECGIVQAPHRGAMRALDVVGVDLELWLGVHPRLARQEQVVVLLLPVS